jgi:hypothetical protein
MRDILTGIYSLVATGLVDRDRQFVYGVSYGGFMTTWLVGHTQQFRAAVAQNAVTDMNVMWGVGDLQSWTQHELGGLPWEVADAMRRHSPLTYAAAIQTPTLVLHSRDDRRCPLPMGRMFHRTLLARDVPTGMVIYPNEGHGIRQPKHQVDVLRRTLAWFEQHDVKRETLRVGFFQADATPPLGSPVAYAPARKIEDPLSARGIVLLGAGKPIVLCAVDWIGIGNGGHDVWRERLAQAAGTTPDRVSVHTLHQHDGARCDFTAEELLAAHGLGGRRIDPLFARQTIDATAEAIRQAIAQACPVTHLGVGQAKVEKVASNRRILGTDGKVQISRMSASRNAEAIAAPEGVIDPQLKLPSFWNGEQPLGCLTYYATHPQSYYGKGDVTAEFVGLARAKRERDLNGLRHIHFNGASGNVAAGKYNDGSPAMRPVLAERMADGMRRAWEATEKFPLTAADIEWRVQPVKLPPAAHLDAAALTKTLTDRTIDADQRFSAALKLAFLGRAQQGRATELSCLRLKNVYVLHLLGELFIEYQLAAQKLRPNDTVCTAAYADYGAGYIGTEIAYSQGGYEVSARSSNVAPQVEQILLDGIRELLK